MGQHDETRQQLEQRLNQLTNRVGKIGQDLRRTLSSDSEERATELENEEVLQALDQDSLTEVRQIREALQRIDDGTYAVCARCGQTIDAARLTAIPSTTTCRTCAT